MASPATVATTLPAGTNLLVRSVGVIAQGVALGTVGGTSFVSKGLTAGGLQRLGYFERGAAIAPLAGLEIMIDIGLGRYRKIVAVSS